MPIGSTATRPTGESILLRSDPLHQALFSCQPLDELDDFVKSGVLAGMAGQVCHVFKVEPLVINKVLPRFKIRDVQSVPRMRTDLVNPLP